VVTEAVSCRGQGPTVAVVSTAAVVSQSSSTRVSVLEALLLMPR